MDDEENPTTFPPDIEQALTERGLRRFERSGFRGNLAGADFSGMDFTYAKLSNVQGLTIEQVLEAAAWDMDDEEKPTTFPADIEEELTRRGMRKKEPKE